MYSFFIYLYLLKKSKRSNFLTLYFLNFKLVFLKINFFRTQSSNAYKNLDFEGSGLDFVLFWRRWSLVFKKVKNSILNLCVWKVTCIFNDKKSLDLIILPIIWILKFFFVISYPPCVPSSIEISFPSTMFYACSCCSVAAERVYWQDECWLGG